MLLLIIVGRKVCLAELKNEWVVATTPAGQSCVGSVCEHSPWAATVGTTEEGFWRGRLPRVATESHIINMIIIKQFT